MPYEEATAFDVVLADWNVIESARATSLAAWESAHSSMADEAAQLLDAGQWRSGGRTLLSALGLHHREVALCAALAWLLRPDGWHGFGTGVLRGLLDHLSLTSDRLDRVEVVTEEVRIDPDTGKATRADIVVRTAETTLVIEAKVFAGEQEDQADRLAKLWADESPELVYLTRYDGRMPWTAVDSEGAWRPLTWRQVAQIARAAAGVAKPTGGALDVIETLEAYGG